MSRNKTKHDYLIGITSQIISRNWVASTCALFHPWII